MTRSVYLGILYTLLKGSPYRRCSLFFLILDIEQNNNILISRLFLILRDIYGSIFDMYEPNLLTAFRVSK